MMPLLAYWPILLGTLGSAGLGGLLVRLLDTRLKARKQSDELALSLVEALRSRVDRLEVRAERKDMIYQLQFRVLRHRANNILSAYRSLLHLISVAPDRAAEFVAIAQADRVRIEEQEATENAELSRLLSELARDDTDALASRAAVDAYR